ncbi:hypothetical protein [Cellulophaga sp. Hel_I_12]|uniref:hypothetical protein n=1 Tax=Cellulophaga sp. Hel_I_12 TaxID=1249972 RepID=UPI001E5C6198|nr:hypothetical protein [Cellulophaga sp. Hel_I_12]
MMKFKFLGVLFFLVTITTTAQVKYEREFRIKKSQFPAIAHQVLKNNLQGAKRLKFYKEIDSTNISYEAKFKKSRLWYSIEFNKEGVLEDIEITINEVDIPNETFDKIHHFLTTNFISYKIKKIQQQYVNNGDEAKVIKDAFQNLMLPYINYEIMCSGKKDKAYQDFEILFNSEGIFKSIRKSLPANYDHVLY